MDASGPPIKSSIVKKPLQTASNKIFPKRAEERSEALHSLPGKLSPEREELSAPADLKENSRPLSIPLESSVLEKAEELEEGNKKGADKTAPDQSEKSESKLASPARETAKSKLANLKVKLHDLKKNDSLDNKLDKLPQYHEANQQNKGSTGKGFHTQGSLQFGMHHESSLKNLIEEPMSADRRQVNFSILNSRDNSNQKEGTPMANSGVSKMVGNMLMRKSKLFSK